MAYLKQRSNSWYAVWYQDRKKIVKSTGVPVKGKKEERLALQTANSMEAAAKGNLQLTRALDAVRSAAESMGMFTQMPLIQDFFKDYKSAGGDSNKSNFNRAASLFLDFLGSSKALRLDRLTPAMCRDFCTERLKQVSYGTVKHNYALLKAAVGSAVRDGILDRNPFSSFSLSSLAPTNKSKAMKRLPFTIEEMRTILSSFPPLWQELTLVSLLTGGQRLGDICLLQWQHVLPEQNIIMFNTQKTGKEIVVPIHPRLLGILKSHADNDSIYVFPQAASKYIRSKGCMSTEFTTLLKAHNIIASDDFVHTQGGKTMARKSFHSIRHTVVTLLRSSTLFTADITRGIVGHDSEEIERQYFTMNLDSKSVGINYLFDVIQKGGEQ